MSSLFQGLAETDGKVRVAATTNPVDAYFRGLAVFGDAVLAELYGGTPPAAYLGGVGVSQEGFLLVSTAAKAGNAPGGLAVDANSILLASQVVEVIHQGVGLTTIGELSNDSLGSLTLADPPPPPEPPIDPFVVAGQNEAQLNLDNAWINGGQGQPQQMMLSANWLGDRYEVLGGGVVFQSIGGAGIGVYAFNVLDDNGLGTVRLWDGSAYVVVPTTLGINVKLVPGFSGPLAGIGNVAGGNTLQFDSGIFVIV